MVQTIRARVVIGAGGVIQFRRADLPEGATAEVTVRITRPEEGPPPLTSLIGKGKGCFRTAAEADAFIRSERDAWDQ